MSAAIHLPDFETLDAGILQEQIRAGIEQLEQFLEELDPPKQPEQALDLVLELERLELELERPYGLLSHLNSVIGSEAYREARSQMQPLVSKLSTHMGQHEGLYAVYNLMAQSTQFFGQLPVDRRRSTDKSIKRFALLGFSLPQDKRERFGEIQAKLSRLSSQFSENVLDSTQRYARALSEHEVRGLSEARLSLLRAAAKQHQITSSEYVATLDIPVYLALMTYSEDRALREELYRAYGTRATRSFEFAAEYDNGPLMEQILALRLEKANLLGFEHFADLSLELKMANSVDEVEQFLLNFADHARPFAESDLSELREHGGELGIDELEPWDLAFVAEKLKLKKFDLNSEELRAYFPFEQVLSGLFEIAQRLFGIQIKPVKGQVWHPDVRLYHVLEAEQHIGSFYLDPFARAGKRGGAWMNGHETRFEATGQLNLPLAFLVCNFAPPTGDAPACLTHTEVTTLFHEFGHGLHHLLTKVSAPGVSGINGVEWDAVELPSQLMENWAWDKQGIRLISKHIETGEALPEALLSAMLAARHFQSGMQALRQVEFSLFDMRVHERGVVTEGGVERLLAEVRAEVSVLKVPAFNHFAHSFSHIFAGGYAAGYYSYKWAELLAFDAFERFELEGVFNPEVGAALKSEILAKGSTGAAGDHFAAFRGRPPSLDALLRHSGWTQPATGAAHAP